MASADARDATEKMTTAVVILNWNTRDFLERFLPPLQESIRNAEGVEIIVADNASDDGSAEMMSEKFPDIRTMVFDRNLGFTGGYNKALGQIDADLFVLLNSDIEVTPGWIGPLVKWMQDHPDCGACAPKLHSLLERDRFEYAGAAGGYIDIFGYPLCRGRVMKMVQTDNGQYDTPREVFWATGACLMVRSSVFRQSGGLDGRFFAHQEEIDLCWRMQLKGWKVNIVPESMVYHLGGGTLSESSPFKLKLNFRNNLLMLANNLARTYALDLFRKGLETEKAARKGIRRSRMMIGLRQILDLISAAAYILTLKPGYSKAVSDAHREYRAMKTDISVDEVCAYLSEYGHKAKVTGRYRKWIVLQAFMKGRKVFENLDKCTI